MTQAAAARRQAAGGSEVTNSNSSNSNERQLLTCKSCQQALDASHCNKNQWSKGEGKARCRACVDKAIQEESQQKEQATAAKLQAAKEKVAQAQASGNATAILKAESELAALEAEKVTGLKPQRMGRGGGGRGRGRAGRGRGGRR